MSADDWNSRVEQVWQRVDALSEADLVQAIDALAHERPEDDPRALFERACARDTAGLEAEAEGFYRAALATPGLDDYRRARATLQLGSTLRLLGRLDDSEQVLVAEIKRREHDTQGVLRDEAQALLALTYLEQGRAFEAAGLALSALAPHLTRYRRSVASHAGRWVPGT